MAGGGVKINNISVRGGANGKTPRFKIENGHLYNTYQDGENPDWNDLGQVKGEKGDKGDKGDKGSGAVDSVNGKTGVVVLDTDDISDTNATHKFVTEQDKATWNGKSVVSVSDTGTATDEISYITINGVEKKLVGTKLVFATSADIESLFD